MKKLFTAIRKKDNETVKALIEKKPELVNCTAKQPPKKDDGQSPLQVALKSGNFEIAEYLINNGADVNFIENESCANDWRMSALHDAITAAVMCCRHNSRTEIGDKLFFEEYSSKEKVDAAFAVLKHMLKAGASICARESFGTTCTGRLCKTAEEILPSYSYSEHRVSTNAVVTSEWKSDLGRIFLLLKYYGADFSNEIKHFAEEKDHPITPFLDMVK